MRDGEKESPPAAFPMFAEQPRPVLVVMRAPGGGFEFKSMGLSPFEAYGLGEYLKKTAERQMEEELSGT